MADPSYGELQSYLADYTQIEAAAHFFPDLSQSAGRSRVQRIVKAGEDHRGPVERRVDAQVAKWGPLDEDRATRVELIRSMAATVDWSRSVHTGQGRTAGIQAAQTLWKFLEDVGQGSDVEDLKKFLLGDDE